MKTKFKYGINYIAIVLAIVSFYFGTLLLLLYKITPADSLVVIGIYYIISAAIVNGLMLILLAINAITHYGDYKENLLTTLGLLANIPITYGYIAIVFNYSF